MSSIDAILITLRKTLEEKKQPLNEQYEVTSQWLARELDLVRKLVQHDPRDPAQNFFEEMTPLPEAPQNKKRKSPETSSEIKLSPEQKRSSVDIKELLVACGFPADLNKLKKEQLLDELTKRGVKQYTMKNLKNELIDALEHAIAAEKRSSFKSEHDAIESMVSCEQETFSVPVSVENIKVHVPVEPVAATTTNIVTESASVMKPRIRQGSLMDEFRKKVYTNNMVDAENAQQKQKIENEFRNRQERHRDSIARKSQILEVPHNDQELEKENQEHEENVAGEEEIQVSKLPFHSDTNTAMDIVSPVKESSRPEVEEADAKEHIHELEEEGKEEDIVYEEKDDEEAKENTAHNQCLATETKAAEPEQDIAMDPEKEEVEEPVEKTEDKEEISDIEEETDKEIATSTMLSQQDSFFQSTNNSQESTKSSLSSTNSGMSHTEPSKKPLNLVGNSSSFLEKQPKKPVIAALEKAKLLKEQEEIRELKKKELKAAKLQAVSAASASNNSTSTSSAANKEKDKHDPRSPWGKMAKGISKVADKVNPFGKKPTDTATTSTVAASAVVSTKPAVTANTNVKPSFDVRAVETKTSLSAAPVVATSSASTSSVVENTSVSLVYTTTSHTISSQPTMPPKSVVKDIVANYHNLVNHTNCNNNTHAHDTHLTSPVRPLPDIVPTAAMVTTTSTSSSTVLAANANISPAPAIPVPVAATAVSTAPMVAEVPQTAHETQASPLLGTPTITPMVAEPHVLRDKVLPPATTPVTTTSLTPSVAVVKAQEVEEDDDDDYDPANNYEIEDTPDSDSDGGSGTEDEDESDKKKQQIPEWARGDKLREALERQYGLNGHIPMDPDLIFPEVQSCSLEEIFGRREGLNRKYNARTSSAHWDADELTLVEKRQYRVHMGYDNAATQQSTAQPRKLH